MNDGHKHRWKYFGSRAGTRCVYCNTTVETRKETATARANALSMMLPGIDYSDKTFEAANSYLDEHRYEILKEAAEKIRSEEAKRYPGPILGAIRRMRAEYYADLIDPEKRTDAGN